jgi:hypothetical protein
LGDPGSRGEQLTDVAILAAIAFAAGAVTGETGVGLVVGRGRRPPRDGLPATALVG